MLVASPILFIISCYAISFICSFLLLQITICRLALLALPQSHSVENCLAQIVFATPRWPRRPLMFATLVYLARDNREMTQSSFSYVSGLWCAPESSCLKMENMRHRPRPRRWDAPSSFDPLLCDAMRSIHFMARAGNII